MPISYVGVGSFASGTGAISVGVPSGIQSGDLLILVASSANQTIATPSGGWVHAPGSPTSVGASGAAGGLETAVFWKAAGASESAVSLADSGSYTSGAMVAFRGVETTNPFIRYGASSGVSSTSESAVPNQGTNDHKDGSVEVDLYGFDRDSTASGTAVYSTMNGTPVLAATTNSGAGGGVGIAYSYLTNSGSPVGAGVTVGTSQSLAAFAYTLNPDVTLKTSEVVKMRAVTSLSSTPTSYASQMVFIGGVPHLYRFSALGSAKISYTQNNGQTWTDQTLSHSDLRKFTVVSYDQVEGYYYGFVETSGLSALYRSTDGRSWTLRSSTPNTTNYWTFGANGGNILAFPGTTSSLMYYSNNGGSTWTSTAVNTSVVTSWHCLYGNSTFVAVPITLSVNSTTVSVVTATNVSTPSNRSFTLFRPIGSTGASLSLFYVGGYFVCVISDNISTMVYRTTDGITWSLLEVVAPPSLLMTGLQDTTGGGFVSNTSGILMKVTADGLASFGKAIKPTDNTGYRVYADGNVCYYVDSSNWSVLLGRYPSGRIDIFPNLTEVQWTSTFTALASVSANLTVPKPLEANLSAQPKLSAVKALPSTNTWCFLTKDASNYVAYNTLGRNRSLSANGETSWGATSSTTVSSGVLEFIPAASGYYTQRHLLWYRDGFGLSYANSNNGSTWNAAVAVSGTSSSDTSKISRAVGPNTSIVGYGVSGSNTYMHIYNAGNFTSRVLGSGVSGFSAAAYGNGKFILGNSFSAQPFRVSTDDGLTFTAGANAASGAIDALVFHDGYFVWKIGNNLYRSPNPESDTSTRLTTPFSTIPLSTGGQSCNRLIYDVDNPSTGILVALYPDSELGEYATSSDGLAWTRRTTLANVAFDAFFVASKLVIVPKSGSIASREEVTLEAGGVKVTANLEIPIALSSTMSAVATLTSEFESLAAALESSLSAVATLSSELTTQIRLNTTQVAQSAVTANLTVPKPLNASLTVTATTTASLTTSILMSCAMTATATVTPTLTTDIRMAAAISALSALLSANLSTQVRLSSALSGVVTTGADLATQVRLVTSLADTASLTASLSTQITLVASTSAASEVTATLTFTAAALESSLQSSGSTTASLTTAIQASSSLASTGTLTAALTTAITPVASLSAQSALTAGLSTSIVLTSALQDVATTTADLGTQIRLASTLADTASVTAALTVGVLFTSALQAESTLAADLLVGDVLEAPLAAESTATATLSTAIRLASALTATSTTTQSLSTAIQLGAPLASQGTLSADLTVGAGLFADTVATTSTTANLTTAIRLVSALQDTASLNAGLDTAIRLNTTLGAQSSLVASLSTDIRLASTTASTSTLTAALSTGIWVATEPQTVTTLTADLTTAILAQANLAAQSTITATLNVQGQFDANLVSESTATADLTVGVLLSAALSSQATEQAELTVGVQLTAPLVGQASSTADLSTAILMASDLQGVSTLGPVTLDEVDAFSSALQASSAITADLTTQVLASAQLAATASLDATLSAGVSLASALLAQSTVTADLTAQTSFGASAVASASLSANLSTGIALVSALASQSAITASLTIAKPLQAALTGQASLAAELSTTIRLSAAATAQSTSTATLSVGVQLQADALAQSSLTASLSAGVSFDAALQSESSLTATLTALHPLDAALGVQTQVSADLSTQVQLSSALGVASLLQGKLSPTFAEDHQPAAILYVLADDLGMVVPMEAVMVVPQDSPTMMEPAAGGTVVVEAEEPITVPMEDVMQVPI